MSKAKEWMKKVSSICSAAVEKYDSATKKGERYIMKKCGSDKMMDDISIKVNNIMSIVKPTKEEKAIPLCRPIPHIPGSYAPMSGMPVCNRKPARMTVGARMRAYAQHGVNGIPMAICKGE